MTQTSGTTKFPNQDPHATLLTSMPQTVLQFCPSSCPYKITCFQLSYRLPTATWQRLFCLSQARCHPYEAQTRRPDSAPQKSTQLGYIQCRRSCLKCQSRNLGPNPAKMCRTGCMAKECQTDPCTGGLEQQLSKRKVMFKCSPARACVQLIDTRLHSPVEV